MHVLGINSFFDTKINFHGAYLDTNWDIHTVAFAGVGIRVMTDIPVNGMLEKLQRSYPERHDEFFEIMGIDINWRMHQFSDGQRRQTCTYYDWSDTDIQGEFIILDNNLPIHMCEARSTTLAHQRVK